MSDPTTRQLVAWTLFAAILGLLGLFTPWPWVGLLPVAWLFWVLGRRMAGIAPDDSETD